MKKRKAVMIDIDDTLCSLQRGLLKHIKTLTGSAPSYHRMNPVEMEKQRSFGNPVTREFLDSIEETSKFKPYPKSLEGFKLLYQAGFELHISSSRLEPVHQITIEWLKKYGFYQYIFKVHPRSSKINGRDFKVIVANDIRALAAFDDSPTAVEALIANGTTVYLIRRPWNKIFKKSDLVKPHLSFYQSVIAFLKENT